MSLRESRHCHGSHTVSGPVAYNVRHIRRPIQIQIPVDEIHPEAPRPIRPSRAHNSGDTHNAIQQRAQRGAHDRIHTGLTRRRSRQRAQRPANGRPERRRGLAYTRERARSLVALDGGTDALDARRPAARLPAALAEQLVDREVPGLGGRLKEPLPC